MPHLQVCRHTNTHTTYTHARPHQQRHMVDPFYLASIHRPQLPLLNSACTCSILQKLDVVTPPGLNGFIYMFLDTAGAVRACGSGSYTSCRNLKVASSLGTLVNWFPSRYLEKKKQDRNLIQMIE